MKNVSSKIEMLDFITNKFGDYVVFTPTELMPLGYSRQLININLGRLRDAGVIEKQGQGKYKLTSTTTAIEYLIAAQQPKSYRDIPVEDLAYASVNEKARLRNLLTIIPAIRSLEMHGNAALTKHFADTIRHEISLYERVLAALTRRQMTPKAAMDRLNKLDNDYRGIGKGVASYMGMSVDSFEEELSRLDDTFKETEPSKIDA